MAAKFTRKAANILPSNIRLETPNTIFVKEKKYLSTRKYLPDGDLVNHEI